MSDLPKPSELAAAAGISPSHASNILAGRREASSEIALNAFRALGVRLGLLADMSDADIAKLCSQKPCDVVECAGGDAAASAGDENILDHAALDTASEGHASTGQFDDMSRRNNPFSGGSVATPSAADAGVALFHPREGGAA